MGIHLFSKIIAGLGPYVDHELFGITLAGLSLHPVNKSDREKAIARFGAIEVSAPAVEEALIDISADCAMRLRDNASILADFARDYSADLEVARAAASQGDSRLAESLASAVRATLAEENVFDRELRLVEAIRRGLSSAEANEDELDFDGKAVLIALEDVATAEDAFAAIQKSLTTIVIECQKAAHHSRQPDVQAALRERGHEATLAASVTRGFASELKEALRSAAAAIEILGNHVAFIERIAK